MTPHEQRKSTSGSPQELSPQGLRDAVRRKGSFMQTLKAVGWSFFGVRKSSEYEKDVSELNPVHVIIAGIIGAVLFIIVLLVLVNWVLSSGVAK